MRNLPSRLQQVSAGPRSRGCYSLFLCIHYGSVLRCYWGKIAIGVSMQPRPQLLCNPLSYSYSIGLSTLCNIPYLTARNNAYYVIISEIFGYANSQKRECIVTPSIRYWHGVIWIRAQCLTISQDLYVVLVLRRTDCEISRCFCVSIVVGVVVSPEGQSILIETSSYLTTGYTRNQL